MKNRLKCAYILYFRQNKVATNLRLKINHTSLLQQLLEIYVILCLLRDYVSRLKHKWTSLHQFSTVDAPKSMFCQSINSVCSVSKMTMVWSKCIVRTSRSGKFFWWGAVRLRKRSRPVCLVPAFFSWLWVASISEIEMYVAVCKCTSRVDTGQWWPTGRPTSKFLRIYSVHYIVYTT